MNTENKIKKTFHVLTNDSELFNIAKLAYIEKYKARIKNKNNVATKLKYAKKSS